MSSLMLVFLSILTSIFFTCIFILVIHLIDLSVTRKLQKQDPSTKINQPTNPPTKENEDV